MNCNGCVGGINSYEGFMDQDHRNVWKWMHYENVSMSSSNHNSIQCLFVSGHWIAGKFHTGFIFVIFMFFVKFLNSKLQRNILYFTIMLYKSANISYTCIGIGLP